MDTKSFDLILSDVYPVFDPEAADLLSENPEMKLGAFLIFGSYAIEGSSIKLKINIFSNAFSKLMSKADIELPMEMVPVGMQVIPADLDKIDNVSQEIDNLYGNSNSRPVIKIDKQYSSKLFSPGRKVVRNK